MRSRQGWTEDLTSHSVSPGENSQAAFQNYALFLIFFILYYGFPLSQRFQILERVRLENTLTSTDKTLSSSSLWWSFLKGEKKKTKIYDVLLIYDRLFISHSVFTTYEVNISSAFPGRQLGVQGSSDLPCMVILKFAPKSPRFESCFFPPLRT